MTAVTADLIDVLPDPLIVLDDSRRGSESVAEAGPGSGSTFPFTLPLIDSDKLQDP